MASSASRAPISHVTRRGRRSATARSKASSSRAGSGSRASRSRASAWVGPDRYQAIIRQGAHRARDHRLAQLEPGREFAKRRLVVSVEKQPARHAARAVRERRRRRRADRHDLPSRRPLDEHRRCVHEQLSVRGRVGRPALTQVRPCLRRGTLERDHDGAAGTASLVGETLPPRRESRHRRVGPQTTATRLPSIDSDARAFPTLTSNGSEPVDPCKIKMLQCERKYRTAASTRSRSPPSPPWLRANAEIPQALDRLLGEMQEVPLTTH